MAVENPETASLVTTPPLQAVFLFIPTKESGPGEKNAEAINTDIRKLGSS